MANRTVRDAKSIRGTNPQYLIEKIIRSRIYDSKYWKEECFALTAELLVDKAMELRFVGGVSGGNIKPSPFLCLALKMLQIQPEKEIVVEFLRNEEFKYVRALAAFYLRLTATSTDCYKYLEPVLTDNRKLRRKTRDGQFEIVHMDEYIDELLREERLCDVILPRIQKRHVLEENNELDPKISALDDDLDEDVQSDEEIKDVEKKENRPAKDHDKSSRRESDRDRRQRSRDRERRPDRKEDKERKREKDRSRSRDRLREKDRDRDRERRHREKDRDRERDNDRDREKEKDHEREKERDREREKDRERDREKEREREKDRDRDREREKERDRDRDKDRNREKEKDRDRHHRVNDRHDDQRKRDRDRRH